MFFICSNMPTRCHTTDLVDALNVEQTNRYLHRMKLKFLIRLSKNELTLLIIRIPSKYEVPGFICRGNCQLSRFTSRL